MDTKVENKQSDPKEEVKVEKEVSEE